MPGSLGHEAIDAQTFAEMGASFLKNDDCGVVYAHAAQDYGAMERAIAALPRHRMLHSVKAPDLSPKDGGCRRFGCDFDWDFVFVAAALACRETLSENWLGQRLACASSGAWRKI